MLRNSHIDSWLTDGGEVIGLTCHLHSAAQKHFLSVSIRDWTASVF
jgi:hypothetical protein